MFVPERRWLIIEHVLSEVSERIRDRTSYAAGVSLASTPRGVLPRSLGIQLPPIQAKVRAGMWVALWQPRGTKGNKKQGDRKEKLNEGKKKQNRGEEQT